ncbi:MAG: exodeoxyribonuclease VII small subunit [Thiomonas sp.]|uniref:exodeoxyribonuclease VII small subunit n=1 Tax=Thiomonas sp. TaxID=2047785 RepID=UPI002A3688AC|nr:exodeoxyribonuclease VII small subunit [Thiomonas sp.]MDY0329865.1 exodeoxyribonuclease VII small subunit [Thiomonas sp.]
MPVAKSVRPADQAPASYEQALAELEQIVQAMEGGQLSLDDTLSSYKRGNLLLQYCRGKLQAVEQQVQVLDGEQLKPLSPEPEEEDDRV